MNSCCRRDFLRRLALVLVAGRFGQAFANEDDDAGKKSGRNSDIILVVFSAKDCGFCMRWKGSLGGRGDLERWPDKEQIRYYIVEKDTLALPFLPEHFPADLDWLWRRLERKNAKLGVPSFRIFVDRKRIANEYGYSSWDTKIFPLLKELVDKKKKGDPI